MNTFFVDLGAPFYWTFLLVAVILLTLVSRSEPRRALLAILNLTFIGLLSVWWGGLLAAAYALLIHVTASVAQSTSRSGVRRAVLAVGAVVAFALFLVHKIGRMRGSVDSPSSLEMLLAAVGFSYVALRTVERLRAGSDRTGDEATWMDTVAYLFPFHMLAAGPIQSWADFRLHYQTVAELTTSDALSAIDRIVRGLFKKFVLARIIELTLLTRFTAPWGYQLLEVQAYYLWVYLDFSAYTDLAVGAGQLLGVSTPENFNRPLGARNIIDFWARWHISLSVFVRRNVFLPLQLTSMRRSGGKHPLLIASVAFAVSFLLVGLWHGLSIRFLLWGAMHAAALILCNLYQRLVLGRLDRSAVAAYMDNPFYRTIATLGTFEFVAVSLAFIVHPATLFLDRAR